MQTGSHTDAIPLAGAYDGTLGVVGGVAALRALQAAGFRPRRGIEVIMFTSEEPTRFALGCSGRYDPYSTRGCFHFAVKSPRSLQSRHNGGGMSCLHGMPWRTLV